MKILTDLENYKPRSSDLLMSVANPRRYTPKQIMNILTQSWEQPSYKARKFLQQHAIDFADPDFSPPPGNDRTTYLLRAYPEQNTFVYVYGNGRKLTYLPDAVTSDF